MSPRKSNPETVIQRDIVAYLRLTRLGQVKRVNTGCLPVGGSNHPWGPKGRLVRFGEVGHSDLVLELAGKPQNIYIEVKCPGNKPTPAQAAFLADKRGRGHFALWTTGVQDLHDQLTALGFKNLPSPGPRMPQETRKAPKATTTPQTPSRRRT